MMRKHVTFADEVLASVSRTPVRFWDGMKVSYVALNITFKGRGTPGTAGLQLTHVWGFLWGEAASAGVSFWGRGCDGSLCNAGLGVMEGR